MNELKLRALESINEGIVITDATKEDNPIIYVNEGFRRITGYSNEDVLHKNCRFMKGPKTDQKTVQKIRDCLLKKTPFSAEILNYRKGGSPFWNLLNITPLRDDSGNVTHFVGVQLDITRAKEAEAHLENTRKKLLATEQLGTTVAISGALAHEIFNPLTVVMNRTRSALRQLEKLSPNSANEDNFTKIQSYLVDVGKMAERIQHIVQKLEAFYEGSKPRELETIDLAHCLNLTFAQLNDRLKAAKITITTDIADGFHLRFNPDELQILISNLLINSIEAIAGQAHPFVKIAATKDEGRIKVTFTDSAPVMPDHLASKIFRPFFTTKEYGNGQGLGLSVANMLAVKNGALLGLERNDLSNIFILSMPANEEGNSAN